MISIVPWANPMSKYSIGTPCPAPFASLSAASLLSTRRLESNVSNNGTEDLTADVEYTRAIQTEFAKARPRRRPLHRKADKNAAVTIFEDTAEDREPVLEGTDALAQSVLLGRPAQRLPALRKGVYEKENHEAEEQVEDFAVQARQRAKAELRKDPRRRTIFVPSDDTTIATIHPGSHASNRLDDTFQLPYYCPSPKQKDAELIDKSTRPMAGVERKGPRMSLAAAPKRMPLQQLQSTQANTLTADVAGQGGGKENLLPEKVVKEKVAYKAPTQKGSSVPAKVVEEEVAMRQSKLFEPTAASQARQSFVSRKMHVAPRTASTTTSSQASGPRASLKSTQRPRLEARLPPKLKCPGQDTAPGRTRQPAERSETRNTKPWRQRPKLSVPSLASSTTESLVQKYPVLAENITQPELYEDHWLSHQEVAITQLLNSLFETASSPSSEWEQSSRCLRDNLLLLYHQDEVTVLHKRLNASLLYGALSQPKDMPHPPRLTEDLGLRRRFLGLWLDSYDEEALSAAAEVVIGRQIAARNRNSHEGVSSSVTSSASLDPHSSRRALVAFLETFLVKVEDFACPHNEQEAATYDHGDSGSHSWRWRKIMIRSLMMIAVLDSAKKTCMISRCLFKRTSVYKSSAAILNTLGSMLIPSVGDIGRVLRHLDYEVSHVQDPLEQCVYRIDNLAIDLRDGIMLSRLVELLLYPPASLKEAADSTLTLKLPDGETLTSAMQVANRNTWPLSQHLKMPCLGRVQKVHNVQVALSALMGVQGYDSGMVTAEDVVDGHRERTMNLLWTLVSRWGLATLVDWTELKRDIRYFKDRTIPGYSSRESTGGNSPLEYQDLEQREVLLQKWASAICHLAGLQVSNLTSSFADSKAYEAIVDAYTCFLPSMQSPLASLDKHPASLEAKLLSIGCSTAFTRQFASGNAMPSRNTTVSSLVFLASRILPLSRDHRAAHVVQRAYRRHRSRRVATKRVVLMRLAAECATVVRTRNRVVHAATVLQRSWRELLARRIGRLVQDVELFQTIARSWMLRKTLSAKLDVVPRTQRVMGGW